MKTIKPICLMLSVALSCSVMAKKNRGDTGDDEYRLPLQKAGVQFTQALTPDDELNLGHTKVQASSKSYYQRVTGAELKRGVSMAADGEEALVRVTPVHKIEQGVSKTSPVLEPVDLELTTAAGKFSAADNKISVKATSQQLNKAHPDLFQNTSAFKIAKEMGKGEFTLSTNKSIADSEEYLVHVFDKNSNVALEVSAAKNSLSQGDNLNVNAHFSDHKNIVSEKVSATLIAPDGREVSLPVSAKADRISINAPLDVNAQRKPGELWKLVVTAEQKDNAHVKRVAEVALDIHQKTASIAKFDNQNAEVQLQVEQPGRYEVRAWVFGKDAQGNDVPAYIQYAAKWFEPGQNALSLEIDEQQLLQSDAKPPFSVKQLQLLDQTRLSALEIDTTGWTLGSGSKNHKGIIKTSK